VILSISHPLFYFAVTHEYTMACLLHNMFLYPICGCGYSPELDFIECDMYDSIMTLPPALAGVGLGCSLVRKKMTVS
jgi:hypothetical protein